MEKVDLTAFQEMKKRLDEIERLIREFRDLGKGLPVVEKNARCLLSFTHALRFGISDPAEVEDR